MSLAERSAATLALGPIVSRLSERLTVPSTRPSTIRSSLPFTSPQITTVLPMRALAVSNAMLLFLPGGSKKEVPARTIRNPASLLQSG